MAPSTNLPPVDRLISGKGEIQIPIQYADARQIFLFVQVVRDPINKFLNKTFNPDKSFYAHVSFCYDDHVLAVYDINFEQQVFEVHNGMSAQNLLALKCMSATLLDVSPIADFGYTIFTPNSMRFECYASTSLRLVLKGKTFDVCSDEDKNPDPPPEPPTKLPKVPPDTGLFVSPPYPDDPNDENTNPDPLDQAEDDTGNVECAVYTVTYSYDATSDGAPTNRITQQIIKVFGQVGSISAGRTSNNDPEIKLFSRGISDFGEPCGEFRQIGISSLTGAGLATTFSNPTIDSIR
jgi:hypothetical protein